MKKIQTLRNANLFCPKLLAPCRKFIAQYPKLYLPLFKVAFILFN